MTDITALILTALKDVGQFAPFPLIGTIAQTALTILEIAETIQSNKESLKALAQDAGQVTYIVITGLQREGRKGDAKYSTGLEEDLQKLDEELRAIHSFISQQKGRNWLKRTVNFQSDKDAIDGHREALNQAMALFGLKSDIALRRLVESLYNEQKAFLDQLGHQPTSEELYGSVKPMNMMQFTITNEAGGKVKVNNVAGDLNVTNKSKKIISINSGNSYKVTNKERRNGSLLG